MDLSLAPSSGAADQRGSDHGSSRGPNKFPGGGAQLPRAQRQWRPAPGGSLPRAGAAHGPVWKVNTARITTYNPRTMTGRAKATSGEEYELAPSAMRTSGLTTLTPGQKLEFKVIDGMADFIKLDW